MLTTFISGGGFDTVRRAIPTSAGQFTQGCWKAKCRGKITAGHTFRVLLGCLESGAL